MSKNKIELNVAVLKALAGEGIKDDLTTFSGADEVFTGELAQAMQELAAQERQERVKAAAGELRKLINVTGQVIAQNVEQIRNLRRQAEEMTQRVAKIARARDYGLETSNFLPLVSALNEDGIYSVPKEWKSKVAKSTSSKKS